MSRVKLTKKQARLLDWLASGMLLESQIVGSGLARALNECLIHGLVDMVAHPTVKERGTHRDPPAAAVTITEAGRTYISSLGGSDDR